MVNDDFYVGYFPIPKKIKKFLLVTVISLFLLSIVLIILIARGQHTPNDGTGWDPTGAEAITLEGVVTQKPYDLFRFRETPNGPINTAILTSMIKTSISHRLVGLYDKPIFLKGVMTRQDGRFVFSVLDNSKDQKSIELANFESKSFFTTPKILGPVTLRGEIIDPKCYLGAMKPGGGKVHKSCAVLCLKGGIPPMFITRNQLLQETYYLVTDEQGEPLLEEIIGYVGDPISVNGVVEKRGDLLVFKLNSQSIKRL